MKLLLIEDNLDLAESLSDFLTLQGFDVDFAYTLAMATMQLQQQKFAAVVLDVNLPDGNGIKFCEQIKQSLQPDVPVIMLTARAALDDKLTSFAVGADDYLTKPFEMAELLARLQVITRRSQPKKQISLQVGELSYNLTTQEIKRGKAEIKLNSSCKKILKLLMEKSPEIISKEELEYALWGYDVPDSDSLKTHMHYLRQQIDKPFKITYLQTVRGFGYCIKA